MIYLDNAATTPLSPTVANYIDQINREFFANPSSLHGLGRKSKKLIDESRQILAQKINAKAEEIIFLSSATEANNLLFTGFADNYDVIITSTIEHPSVLEPVKASKKPVVWIDVDQEGFVDLEALEQALASNKGKKILVSIMHGNNEIGTVQDLVTIGKICKKHQAYFHSDCVQTFAKLPIDVEAANLDFVSVSGHKFHAPKGIGFLYKKAGLEISPIIFGGGQESQLRSGTENMTGIAAIAKAAAEMNGSSLDTINKLQEKLITSLKQISGIAFNGSVDLNKRVPGNINISLPKLKSEQIVLQMDLAGICISAGSACSSSKQDAVIESSYVLRACKLADEQASSSVRISISKYNSEEDLEKLLELIQKLVA